MYKITKTKTNADALLELEARRRKVLDVISNADWTVMAKICSHCKFKNGCFYKNDISLLRNDDECVNGTLDWLEKEIDE